MMTFLYLSHEWCMEYCYYDKSERTSQEGLWSGLSRRHGFFWQKFTKVDFRLNTTLHLKYGKFSTFCGVLLGRTDTPLSSFECPNHHPKSISRS